MEQIKVGSLVTVRPNCFVSLTPKKNVFNVFSEQADDDQYYYSLVVHGDHPFISKIDPGKIFIVVEEDKRAREIGVGWYKILSSVGIIVAHTWDIYMMDVTEPGPGNIDDLT